MKKILSIGLVLTIMLITFTGCGSKEENLDYTLEEILSKVYAPVGEDCPRVVQTKLDDENLSYYLGVESLDYEEGIASEPAMSSKAHSVVVVKVKDGVDVEKTKEEIKEKVNPAKWICVEASSVIVESKGNVIILIMLDNSNIATKMQESFKNLK